MFCRDLCAQPIRRDDVERIESLDHRGHERYPASAIFLAQMTRHLGEGGFERNQAFNPEILCPGKAIAPRRRKGHGRLRCDDVFDGTLKVSAEGACVSVIIVNSIAGRNLIFLTKVQNLPPWQTATRKDNAQPRKPLHPVPPNPVQRFRTAQPSSPRERQLSECSWPFRPRPRATILRLLPGCGVRPVTIEH